MANLQVKNFPESLHQRLRHYAQAQHSTINDIVLGAIEREVARYESHEKLAQGPPADLEAPAASLPEQERTGVTPED